MRRLLIAIFPLLFSVVSVCQTTEDKEKLSNAIEYFNNGKYHEAGLLLRQLNKSYSLNTRFKAYLALCEYHEWNYSAAASLFDEIRPELGVYYPHEQSVYYFAAAESHFFLENYRAAMPYYELTLTVCYEKEKGEVYYRLGFCHLFTDDRPTARLLFEKALAHYQAEPTGKNDTARVTQLRKMIKSLPKSSSVTSSNKKLE